MKKLFFTICALLISVPAWGATYYVRNDGGTDSQCTGTSDASVASSPNCAFVNIMYAYRNFSDGDTILIDERDHAGTSPIGKAQYCVGYGCPGYQENVGGCTSGNRHACNPYTIHGIDAGNTGKVYGRQYATADSRDDCPEIYGVGGVTWNLRHGSNVDIQCLDLTDHSRTGVYGTRTEDGVSHKSVTNSGDWSRHGILSYHANNVNYKNLWIHGFAFAGIDLRNPKADQVWTNVYIHNNNGPGVDEDHEGDTARNFYLTADEFELTGSGCIEQYPLIDSSDLKSHDNMFECISQDQGGFSDGFSLEEQATNAKIGKMTFTNFLFQDNIADALDYLYADGPGEIEFRQGTFRGNTGNMVKIRFDLTAENVVFSGDCNHFAGQPWIATTARADIDATGCATIGGTWVSSPGYCSRAFGDHCRSAGQSLIVEGGGWTWTMRNVTVIGEGDILIYYGCGAGTCTIDFDNVILASMEKWDDPGNKAQGFTQYTFGGTMSINRANWIAYNFREGCPSGADCSDPLFNDPTDYTEGTPGHVYDFTLQSSSPAINAGANITLTDTDEDYFGCPRDSLYDIGAIEYPNNETCTGAATQCSDGVDNDADTLIDYPNDPGCSSFSDNDETDPPSPQCSDFSDNDGDGYTDYPNDPGCTSADDNDESNDPECSDGVDNDGDGDIDYPADADCVSIFDTNEAFVPACGDTGYCGLCGSQNLCEAEVGCEWSLEQGLEDFGTYTEVDPSTSISVSTHSTTATNLQKSSASYLRRDFVSSPLESFLHKVSATISSTSGGSRVGVWAINNGAPSLNSMLTTPSLGFALTYNYRDISDATRYQWTLNENTTSATVADSYGGVGGTLRSSTSSINTDTVSTSGKLNTAFSFNGSTSTRNVNLGDNLEFSPTDEFSCGAWMKTSSTSGQAIIGKIDCGSGCPGWGLDINGGEINFFIIIDIISGNKMSANTSATYADGAWHFVGFSYDGTLSNRGVTIYVDGAESTLEAEAEETITSSLNYANSILCIGAYCYSSSVTSPFNGTLDNVFCVDRALTAEEWSALYNSGTGTETLEGVSGDWRLESFTDDNHNEVYQSDSYSTSTIPQTVYPTITRSGSSITAQLYSDSARTSLLDTLSLTGTPVDGFRYAYSLINSGSPGNAQTTTFTVSNLDLGGSYACIEAGSTPTCEEDCDYCFTQDGCVNTGPSCDWCDGYCADAGMCPANEASGVFEAIGNVLFDGAVNVQ